MHVHVGWCYAVGYVRCQDELLACRHTCWGSRRRQCCGLAWVMENRVHHRILIWRYPGSVTDHYRWVVLLFGPLAPRRVGPLSSQAERPFAKGPSAAYSCRPSSEPELQPLHTTLRQNEPATAILFSEKFDVDCPQAFPKLHQGRQAPSRERPATCPSARPPTDDVKPTIPAKMVRYDSDPEFLRSSGRQLGCGSAFPAAQSTPTTSRPRLTTAPRTGH